MVREGGEEGLGEARRGGEGGIFRVGGDGGRGGDEEVRGGGLVRREEDDCAGFESVELEGEGGEVGVCGHERELGGGERRGEETKDGPCSTK